MCRYATKIQDPSQRLKVDEAITELDGILEITYCHTSYLPSKRDFTPKGILGNLLPAVAVAQRQPNDRVTVEKVSAPAQAAINALDAILSVSSLAPEDSIYLYILPALY